MKTTPTDQNERTIESKAIDMSPEGIDRRMREVAQLYRLGVEIAKARRLGKLRDLRQKPCC
jgi:hypothetical protein